MQAISGESGQPVAAEKPITATLKGMAVGEVEAWPLRRMPSVKALVTTISQAWDKKYKTKVDTVKRVIYVTRLA